MCPARDKVYAIQKRAIIGCLRSDSFAPVLAPPALPQGHEWSFLDAIKLGIQNLQFDDPLMPKLVLATCGCIQAEHTARLVGSLLEIPALEIVVVATPRSLEFFDRREVEAITGGPIYSEHRDASERFPIPHIHLAEWADLVIVFPASATTMARCAHGFADTLVSNLVLAARCPVYFGPSMNPAMLENPVVQKNIERLKAAGYRLIPRVPTEVLTHSDRQIKVQLACTEDTVKAICHHVFAD